MRKVEFKKGSLQVNIKEERTLAMFLCFSQSNLGSDEYISILNSLPKIKGLRSAKNRSGFTFDLVNTIHSKGYKIIKK